VNKEKEFKPKLKAEVEAKILKGKEKMDL